MPNSYIEPTPSNSAIDVSSLNYISIDDLHARGSNNGGTSWTNLTISSRDASAKTVTVTSGASYSTLRIYRLTTQEPLVDFTTGAVLTEADLDKAYQQGLFAAQEVNENASGQSVADPQNIEQSQLASDFELPTSKLAVDDISLGTINLKDISEGGSGNATVKCFRTGTTDHLLLYGEDHIGLRVGSNIFAQEGLKLTRLATQSDGSNYDMTLTAPNLRKEDITDNKALVTKEYLDDAQTSQNTTLGTIYVAKTDELSQKVINWTFNGLTNDLESDLGIYADRTGWTLQVNTTGGNESDFLSDNGKYFGAPLQTTSGHALYGTWKIEISWFAGIDKGSGGSDVQSRLYATQKASAEGDDLITLGMGGAEATTNKGSSLHWSQILKSTGNSDDVLRRYFFPHVDETSAMDIDAGTMQASITISKISNSV
tara:strand:+ start:3183 stop:4466 length:1284 start_codon:yes stop_codon:yes gene_type:complete